MDGPTTEITRTKYRYEFFPWISSSSQLIVDGKKKKSKFFPFANIMNTSLLAVTGVSYELLNINISS